ncbi:TcfC E-set like domain-containing protein [Aliikangiella sp. G2MR2-5]|uniref:TcfC E-set like domain-containing protein n=1 Tax=Aliikangiella sp. G2MR2-5 TaxID=2788943 RepID=UPI0018AA4FE8|nr:TcfC E-set like domain-containing protein [Aliikangiella sp. G2MR2-5]
MKALFPPTKLGIIYVCMMLLWNAPLLTAAEADPVIFVDAETFKNAQAEPVITTEAPAGFEDLMAEQSALVDVVYQGRMLGSVMVVYTIDYIRFEEPTKLLSLLENVKSPDRLLSALSLPLATNTAQICFYQGQASCGVLYPQTVGVIFDESQLRVTLFINPELQSEQALALEKYLPPSDAGPSLISSFSLVASGGDQREDVHTARLNNTFGFGNHRLIADFESDSESGERLDQLSLTFEQRDLSYQIGTFRTTTYGNSFYSQNDFMGLRVASTLASRTDLEQVSGTQLFVFLNERSRVEIYVDGELIDAQSYPAGNIELDTRTFPEGAYNLELKIIGDSGQERTETHFYSKSLQLPPQGEWLYFVELGYPEDDLRLSYPTKKQENMFRAGALFKPKEFLGLSTSLTSSRIQQGLEVGSYWFGDGVELQTNHARNSDQDYAHAYLVNLRMPNFYVSASYRRNHIKSVQDIDLDYAILGPRAKQTSLNIGVPLNDANLNIFSRSSESLFSDKYRAIGVSFRKNLMRTGGLFVDWTLDASKENDERRIAAGISIRFIQGRVGFDSRMNFENRRTQNEDFSHWNNSARISYSNPELALGRLHSSLGVNRSEFQSSAELQSTINSDFGYGRLILDRIQPEASADSQISNSENQSNYSIATQVNLVSGGGEVALGGDRVERSGVMLDLRDFSDKNLSFIVTVNGAEKARIQSGASSFIALQPYHTYRLSLTPKGQTLVHFDSTPREFTLYPGNVKSLQWKIQPIKVAIFQLIDPEQKPFANAFYQENGEYGRSDDQGWVQQEVPVSGLEMSFTNIEGSVCRVVISPDDLTEGVNFLGQRGCND